MSNLETDVRSFIKDVGSRALNTAWQTGAGVAITLWISSGLSVHDLASANGWHKLYTVVVVGVIAAILSALKTMLVGFFTTAEANGDADKVLVTAEKAAVTVAADVASGDKQGAVNAAEDAVDDAVETADADVKTPVALVMPEKADDPVVERAPAAEPEASQPSTGLPQIAPTVTEEPPEADGNQPGLPIQGH